MSVPSFVRVGATGLEELGGDGSSKFLKLKPGKPIEIQPLTGVEGIVSFNQHAMWLDEGSSPIFPCFGKPWCPGEILGDKPRFRALLLCVVRDDPDTEMILPMGMSMFKQMVQIEEAIGGSMKGHIIRITRTGESLNTKYTVMPTGRRNKVTGEPDTNLLEHIGPTTPEEVIEMLEKANLWTEDNQAEYDARRAEWKKTLGKAAPKSLKAPVDDEDDDLEEISTPVETSKAKKPKGKPAPVEDDDEFEDLDEE